MNFLNSFMNDISGGDHKNSVADHNEAETQESTVDKVVRFITGKIYSRDLKAGDRLPPENELCSMLNVSRTSVREAIKYLKALMLVDVKRGDGTYISQPDDIMLYSPLLFKLVLGDAKWSEVFEFRESIEFMIVKFAIKYASSEDIQELKRINDIICDTCRLHPDNFYDMHHYDILFHETLAKSTGNRMMQDVYKLVLEIFSPLILQNYKIGQGVNPTKESHSLIIEAIEKRDIFLAGYAASVSVESWSTWIKKQNNRLFAVD